MPRRILLVDDQRDITRMLRAVLEHLIRGCVVVDVPSGEEAMLEVQRGPFDLVVTDVRLPGISGLELVARVHKANPRAQVFVISGLSLPEVEQEARRLDADAFFPKPLDTDKFLEAVRVALGGAQQAHLREADAERVSPGPAGPGPTAPSIADRLLDLRRDLGAAAVFLADTDGHVEMSAGDVARLDVAGLLTHLVVSFSAALNISRMLGSAAPAGANIHFFDGKDFDLYTINVGQNYLLVVVFQGERGARAMGPVITYGRACAENLLHSLAALGVEAAIGTLRAAPGGQASPPDLRPSPEETAQQAAPAAPDPAFEELLERHSGHADAPGAAQAFWTAPPAEASADESKVAGRALSFEQAQKLGLLPKELPPGDA